MMEAKNTLSKYFSQSDGDGFIINTELPEFPLHKDIEMNSGLNPSEYGEFCDYLEKNNKILHGDDISLLPPAWLAELLKIPNRIVVMRSKQHGKIIGTVMSFIIPVRVKENNHTEIISHGCTTGLNVIGPLRKLGMGLALQLKIASECVKQGTFCSYHMIPRKIGNNSVKLQPWSRPVNLQKIADAGFTFPGLGKLKPKTMKKLYNVDIPSNYSYQKVTNSNMHEALDLYFKFLDENAKFAFWPDADLWRIWIDVFPTYIIMVDGNPTGLVSACPNYSRIEHSNKDIKFLSPVVCVGDMDSVIPVFHHICEKLDYDCVYYFSLQGCIKEDVLKKYNCQENNSKDWFVLYNNRVSLELSDIHVPLL